MSLHHRDIRHYDILIDLAVRNQTFVGVALSVRAEAKPTPVVNPAWPSIMRTPPTRLDEADSRQESRDPTRRLEPPRHDGRYAPDQCIAAAPFVHAKTHFMDVRRISRNTGGRSSQAT